MNDKLEDFIREEYSEELIRLHEESNEEERIKGLPIHFLLLLHALPDIANDFIYHPLKYLDVFDDIITQVYTSLVPSPTLSFKARIFGLPKSVKGLHQNSRMKCDQMKALLESAERGERIIPRDKKARPRIDLEEERSEIPRSKDINRYMRFRGTVVRTGPLQMFEWQRELECLKCKHRFRVTAVYERFNQFDKVRACPGPRCKARTPSFKVVGASACRDYQELKVQEQVARLEVGAIPRAMTIVLEDDLVDGCKAGDDITLHGVVLTRWKTLADGIRVDAEIAMKATHLQVNNEMAGGFLVTDQVRKAAAVHWENYGKTLLGRDVLVRSFCPQLHAMHVVKLLILLVTIGGCSKVKSDGARVRGDIHCLLVGDPGVAKSQFLSFAAQLSPRSVRTTGIGTTGAGLTVAAVRDGRGEFGLEAGALVLADGGICCIDEFSQISKNDKASMHEAMEQQTLSVAKAGIVCTLNTRTAILAATNPKVKYDCSASIGTNTALAPPLLSRFDLILVLLDNQNKSWDETVSSFILDQKVSPPAKSVDVDFLRAYVLMAKEIRPVLSERAQLILTTYYQLLRSRDTGSKTTIRMLETLVRIAMAHARLMMRPAVTEQDAIITIMLMETTLTNPGAMNAQAAFRGDFLPDPDNHYIEMREKVLELIHLTE